MHNALKSLSDWKEVERKCEGKTTQKPNKYNRQKSKKKLYICIENGYYRKVRKGEEEREIRAH